LLTQIVGLITVNRYIEVETVNGTKTINHRATIIGEPPEIEDKTYTFISIVIAILIGTGILFLLIKFRLGRLWKYWFLLSVWITLSISLDVYITTSIALILAAILAILKVYKKNVFVHNFTEIFIYTGITIIILPFLNLFSAIALLIAISLYDAYAVWKSKHMIKLAKFQTKNRLFAGLYVPYKSKIKIKKGELPKPQKYVKEKKADAILGGGDMAFPLLFSATVMEHLILLNNIPKIGALLECLIIALTSTIALLLLFVKGQQEKFYPAMPFISLGCFIGLGIIMIINL
jgi:presenilin-like A22 family membrane protease